MFAGPFTLEGADTVAAGDDLDHGDIDDLLQDLVEKSMVTVASGPSAGSSSCWTPCASSLPSSSRNRRSPDLAAERHAHWCLTQVTDIHHRSRWAG